MTDKQLPFEQWATDPEVRQEGLTLENAVSIDCNAVADVQELLAGNCDEMATEYEQEGETEGARETREEETRRRYVAAFLRRYGARVGQVHPLTPGLRYNLELAPELTELMPRATDAQRRDVAWAAFDALVGEATRQVYEVKNRTKVGAQEFLLLPQEDLSQNAAIYDLQSRVRTMMSGWADWKMPPSSTEKPAQ